MHPMSDTLTTSRIRTTMEGLGRRVGAGRVAELLEELQADPLWGRAHIDLEQRLWRKTGMDPAFSNHMKRVNQVVADRLWSKMTPREFNRHWKGLEDKDRIELLQKVVDLQARLYGVETVPLNIKPLPDTQGIVYIRGQYRPDQRDILINSDPERDVWKDGPGVLALALHEGAHAVQHRLVDRLEAGDIVQGHPWYDQARLFRASFNMVSLCEKKDVGIRIWNYFVIPTERHGHAVERHIKRAGRKASIARIFSPAPDDMTWLVKSLAKPAPQDLSPPQVDADRPPPDPGDKPRI
ncbi:MAG: hypothetical protein Alpg2KO_30020 [Alphaproteobacteria bacterium]